MKFDFAGLGTNLVSDAMWSVVFFALAMAYNRMYDYFRYDQRYRRVWGLPRGEQTVEVSVARLKHTFSRVTSLSDIRAVSAISESLIQGYGAKRVKLHIAQIGTANSESRAIGANAADREKVSHPRVIVAVGGPRYNGISERALAEAKTRFHFERVPRKDDAGNVVKDDAGKPEEMYVLHDGESPLPEGQYAVLYRLANPFNKEPGSAVFVLAGLHAEGVTAAGRALVDESMRSLAKTVKGLGPYWEVLFRVHAETETVEPDPVSASVRP